MRLLVVGACALAAAALSGASSSSAPPALLTYSISYRADPSGPLNGRICVAQPDGTHAVRVMSKGWYTETAWSPGGRYLAYSRQTTARERKRLHNKPVYEIFLATARGRVVRNLSKGTSVFNMQPAWSPDGRRLAFTSAWHDPQSIISVVSRKGGLPYTVAVGASPTWSPDGSRILFAAYDGIESVSSDGPPDRKLIVPGATSPALSPDGTKLAYVRRAPPPSTDSDVFVANADGTGDRRLTDSVEEEWGPTWSPDGSLIAFTRSSVDATQRQWVVVVRSDSGEEYAVIRGPHSAFDPSWRTPVNLPRAKRLPCF